MRRALVSLGLIVLCAPVTSAQLVVTDPAVTIRNTVTATLKEYLLRCRRNSIGSCVAWRPD